MQNQVTGELNIAVGGGVRAIGVDGSSSYVLHTRGGHVATESCSGGAVHRQARQRIGGTYVGLQLNVAVASGQIQCPGIARVTVDGAGHGDITKRRRDAGGQGSGGFKNHVSEQADIASGGGVGAIGVDGGSGHTLCANGGHITAK